MTTLTISYVFPPLPVRHLDWCVIDENYDGAPDAGWQCTGAGATEFLAVLDYYDNWEVQCDDEPCIVHRPLYAEDLGCAAIS